MNYNLPFCKYTTNDGIIHAYLCKDIINLISKNIIDIYIPNHVTHLWIKNNKIKNLILPKNIKFLDCVNNSIEYLKLNENINVVYCDINVNIDSYLNNSSTIINLCI